MRRIGRPVGRFLTFSPSDDLIFPGRALCVSLEKGGTATAYGSRFLSRIKIRGFRHYGIDEDRYPTPDETASAVTLAINDLRARKGQIILMIPKAWVMTKTAELPLAVKENLQDVIAFELDRLTPLSAEEAYYDFRIVGEDEEKLSLTILAARTEVIDPYINALRDKGVTVSAIAVSLAGVGTLCHFMDRKTDTLYIETNERGYDGTLFSKGSIVSSLSAQFSSDDETSQSRQLGADLMRLAHNDDDRGEPKVILHMKRKSQTLRELVRLGTNMNVLMIDEVDLRLAMREPQSNVPYAAVAGVLDTLWPAVKQGRLNLMTKGRHQEVRTPRVLTLILCLVIIAAAVYYMISPIQIEEKRLKELDRQIALRKGDVKKVESLKKEIESVKKEIAVIENFKKNRPMTMTIVKEITSVLPKTAWLTRLRITETTVEIEGYSNSATEILSKLEASKHLRKAEFASPTFRDVRMNAERFIIKMELEGVKKEEGEKPKSGPKK